MQAVYIWFGGLRKEGKILVRLKTTGAKTTFTSGNDAGPLHVTELSYGAITCYGVTEKVITLSTLSPGFLKKTSNLRLQFEFPSLSIASGYFSIFCTYLDEEKRRHIP